MWQFYFQNFWKIFYIILKIGISSKKGESFVWFSPSFQKLLRSNHRTSIFGYFTQEKRRFALVVKGLRYCSHRQSYYSVRSSSSNQLTSKDVFTSPIGLFHFFIRTEVLTTKYLKTNSPWKERLTHKSKFIISVSMKIRCLCLYEPACK